MKRLVEDVFAVTAVTTAAAKKPVFLTKAQREELALKRRQQEADQLHHRRQKLLSSLGRPSDVSASTSNHDAKPSDSDRDRDRDRRDRERDRDHEFERRSHRERDREEEARARERERTLLEKLAERERDKELDAIKEQYLGLKKPKKRVIKPREKFHFSFDWENTEDTSRDMNALYQNPYEAQLLFGLGFRAGMDRREQKKLAAKNEKEMREEICRKDGVEERPDEAAARGCCDRLGGVGGPCGGLGGVGFSKPVGEGSGWAWVAGCAGGWASPKSQIYRRWRYLSVGSVLGWATVGGCVSVLVQWAVMASLRAEVGVRGRERSLLWEREKCAVGEDKGMRG